MTVLNHTFRTYYHYVQSYTWISYMCYGAIMGKKVGLQTHRTRTKMVAFVYVVVNYQKKYYQNYKL